MDAMNAILSRRSIRKYTDQAVPDEMIKTLLAAAMSAPSVGNLQPWQFVVIDESRILNEIPAFHPYSAMLTEAPAAILVCYDQQLVKLEVARKEPWWIQDCSAATENLLIAANATGLGAVWLGVYPIEERVAGMRKLLGIPAHIVPFSLVSLGFPAEEKPQEDRYDDSKVRRNRW